MVADCVDMSDAGSSSASLRGFSGKAGSWCAGSTSRPISLTSYGLPSYASCAGNCEIGSSV